MSKQNKYKNQLDRRAFLKVGSLTLALPVLESMMPSKALAAGTADSKRYVCMYIPSGTYMSANDGAYWQPRATGPLDPNNLPEVFKPFGGNAKEFSVLRGVRNESRNQCMGAGGGHSTCVATYLTCVGYTDGNSDKCTIAGSSFDQTFASQNGLKAFAMSAGGADGYHPDGTPFDYGRTVSYNNGQQVETWLNPYKLFFSAGLFQDMSALSQSPLAKNKSILDSAVSAINQLKARVGITDRQRLDDYFSGLRALETSLASSPPPVSATCSGVASPPKAVNSEDHSGDQDDFPARLKAFCDIMILAFKCDRAQAFSLMFEYENTNRRFRNLIPSNLIFGNANMDRPGSHNEVAHWGSGGAAEEQERRNRCVTRDRYYMSYVNYLISELKNATDPSGSPILDNTIIQFGHGLEEGNHNFQTPDSGLPLVLAGGRNMINPGYLHNVAGADLKDLYFTLNQKLGLGLSNFRGSSKVLKI